MILTKAPWIFDPNGDRDREDITSIYKAKEGKYESIKRALIFKYLAAVIKFFTYKISHHSIVENLKNIIFNMRRTIFYYNF